MKKKTFFTRLFSLIGWFFKCDFWNPGKISDRHRCSEKKFLQDETNLKKSEILALLNLYKELKHSLYKTYKGNASIPYINSKVPQKCQDVGIF